MASSRELISIDQLLLASFVSNLIKIFGITLIILKKRKSKGYTYSQRGNADVVYNVKMSFKFVFVLQLVKDIFGMSWYCVSIIATTNLGHFKCLSIWSKLRKHSIKSWEKWLGKVSWDVKLFCERHDI